GWGAGAGRWEAGVENAGVVARLGGDEFAIVMSGPAAVEQAANLAERTCRTFDDAIFSIGENDLRVNVSIGVAAYPDHCVTADELFGNADLARYRAKATGRGRHVTFTPAIRDDVQERLTLETNPGHTT